MYLRKNIIILLIVLLIPLFLGIDANASSPKKPDHIKYTTGNFWMNFTWSDEKDTDSFNISVNGKWINGTKDTFMNITSIPHGIVNIALAGYDEKSQKLSEFEYASAQIPNNPITIIKVQTNYSLFEGEILYIDAGYIDIDNDIGLFATTATKGTFDTATGILSWRPVAGDRGIYKWEINVIDANNSADFKSSISSQMFTVTVYPNTPTGPTSSTVNFGIRFIEPSVINDNGIWTEAWRDASVGHIGKFIGIDGIFNNTGEDLLAFTITDNPPKYCPTPCYVTLSNGQSKTFMEAFWGRHDFEIDSSDLDPSGLFSYTLNISVIGYSGSNPTFSYDNSTTISLPIIPIFRMKYADGGIAGVAEGATTTITYTLEANSSVNLKNVSIYDPFYPVDQNGPYFNISNLQVNKSKNNCFNDPTIVDCKKTFTYKATPDILQKFKCLGGIPCIINFASFKGITESGKTINDTDFVRIFTEKLTPVQNSRSSGGGGGGGGGGGMPPSEDFNNIEKREVREKDVLSKMAVAYTFNSADPVAAVSFESRVSENGVPVAVEVLRNRSTKIAIDAPGELYKYFNVFVGMSGFSKKVSNGVIVYRINNNWLKEKNIDPDNVRLYKWDGNWTEKNTKLVENKSNYTYYASFVGNFSSFAIVGIREDFTPALMSITSNESLNESTLSNVKEPQSLNSIIGGVMIIGILGIMYYIKIKYRK